MIQRKWFNNFPDQIRKMSLDNFITWQCFLRQRNFRKFSGKPSEGTIASIYDENSNDEITNLRSVLVEKM